MPFGKLEIIEHSVDLRVVLDECDAGSRRYL